MKYMEKVHWILDKLGTTIQNQDEHFKENISFVHSLGKKCDSVGWSTLSKDDPKAEEILRKISAFCQEKGWVARGVYYREYTDFDTDWYQIVGTNFPDSAFADYVKVPARDGSTITLCSIKAYQELTAAPKCNGNDLYMPERFFNAYREKGLTDLDFCWVKDTGKYAAQQYFAAFGIHRIPRAAVAWDLGKQDLRKLPSDGGWLPRLGEVFQKWNPMSLPYCYRKEDMPCGGIVYAYIPRTNQCCGLYQLLVHKDMAQKLLQEKVIPAGALRPAPVLENIPSGYTLRETADCPRPTKTYMEQSFAAYEALKKKDRPIWQILEKDALKILRKAKAGRKENFGKALPKAKGEALTGTPWASMLPYYGIANGGQLSDEYRLLSAEESLAETKEFYTLLENEDLLEEKPEGIVICTCANGDWVLLSEDGAVIRFSHEAPEMTEQWPSLAQFMVGAIN